MTSAAADPGGPSAGENVTSSEQDLLSRAFSAYNAQDADGLLALVSDDVDWPDGSGRLQGKAALRAYWRHQWTRTRTHDQPTAFSRRPDGRVAVRLIRVVRSLDGSVISRGTFHYVFRIERTEVVGLDIEDA